MFPTPASNQSLMSTTTSGSSVRKFCAADHSRLHEFTFAQLIETVADHKVLLACQHSFAMIGDFKRREQDLSGIHRGGATVVLLHQWLRRQRQPAHRRI